MNTKEFFLAAWKRTLTAEELKVFFDSTHKDDVERVFKAMVPSMLDLKDGVVKIGKELIETKDPQFKEFNEFSRWFGELIQKVGDIALLDEFVTNVISHEIIHEYAEADLDYRMSEENFLWLITDAWKKDSQTAEKIFMKYANKRQFTLNEQIMLLNNSSISIWQKFVDGNELDCRVQHLMIQVISGNKVKFIPQDKVACYCEQHRLCEEAEVLLVRSCPEVGSIVENYAWRWGLCSRAMSGILCRLDRRMSASVQ